MILRLLRWLMPGWAICLWLVFLSGTGLYLRNAERFASLAWGLTEMVHVHTGWIGLAALTAYLVHHLARTWGPLGHRQRILGLALLALCAVAWLTGIVLVLGLQGGPPAFVVALHHLSTWGLLAVMVWHTVPGWTRWLKRRWRRMIDGPQPAPSPTAAAPAPTPPAPAETEPVGT
jgi:hypothetical protein